jgi:flagellar biosynthesis/type III secretory pathway protein FliH
MNNEPVAWIDPKELDMDVSTSVTKNKQFESDIPLYVQPQKYCPSENNEAYEKGFIDGMAKQRDSKVQQMVESYTHPVKELTDEEIIAVGNAVVNHIDSNEGWIEFARAILRKAQEK